MYNYIRVKGKGYKQMKDILGAIIGIIFILGFFTLVNIIGTFILAHFWLMIPMAILVIYLIIKNI